MVDQWLTKGGLVVLSQQILPCTNLTEPILCIRFGYGLYTDIPTYALGYKAAGRAVFWDKDLMKKGDISRRN